MHKWAYEHMKKCPFFALPNHWPLPLQFLPGIHVFTNQNLKTLKKFRWETQREKKQKTKQIKSKPLCLHIKPSIRTIKRIQIKYFFVLELRLGFVITRSSMEYTLEYTTANHLIDYGKKRLSKQLIVLVNRLCHVQLKGNLEKKIGFYRDKM